MPRKALADGDRQSLFGLFEASCDLHLDTVCRAAAAFFDVPIVLVTLIDGTHVRIRAGSGIEATTAVPRGDACCDRTIRGKTDQILVIPDLLLDDEYRSSPLVTGAPMARFYAGASVSLSSGMNVGTLCLMDTRPRSDFDGARVKLLRDLARVVEEHFRLYEASAVRREETRERQSMASLLVSQQAEVSAARKAQSAAETAASFGQWRLLSANGPVLCSEGIARIFGRAGRVDNEVGLEEHISFYHFDDRRRILARIQQAFAGHGLGTDGGYQVRARIVRPDGEVRHVLVEGNAARDERGRVTSLCGVLLDVTDLTRSERQAHDASELLRSTLENMDQGLIMLGSDGSVRIHNRRIRELLDLPEGLLSEGASFEGVRRFLVERGEYLDADDKARAWSTTGGIEREATSYERRRPDGTALEIRAVPLNDGGVVRTFTDVSRRKAVERTVQESEARYRLLADNTTDVIIWSGLDTVRRYVSPAAVAVLGYYPDELVGTMPLDFTHPDDAERFASLLRDLCEGRIEHAVGSQRYRRKDGSWIWIEASFSLTRDTAGTATGYVASLRDISERKGIEDALRDSEERLSLALDCTSDGIWDLDVATGKVRLSGAWLSILGYAESEIEPGLAAWRELTHPEDYHRSETALVRHLKGETVRFECEYRIRTKAGRYIWTLARGRVVARDARGRALRMVGTQIDITQRKEAELLIAHMALHDSMTGLANRALFKDRLEQSSALVRRDRSRFAVLACDLDRFKAVNDMLGHAAGDHVLKSIAGRLQATVREHDTVARLGGDEFAIILGNLDHPREANRIARQVIAAVGEPIEVEGRSIAVGISIGIAVGIGDVDAENLLKQADIALFRAKADGRDTFRFFEAGMDAAITDRNLLEQDMKEAVRQGAFVLHYQPVIDVATRTVGGFEALMRWVHPTRGSISPAVFIPIAEESGLIVQLGVWALREACQEAAAWPGAVRIAVNVSTMQFRQEGLEAIVANALASSGLAPHRLELEITESVLVHDAEGVIACLHRLRALGIRIALDDFGTGYSSLEYLRRFPFDKIKIDRSFVQDLDDPGTAAIVRAVIGLGRRVGASLTAEGVETERQFARIARMGCTEAQGFLFGAASAAGHAEGLSRCGDMPIERAVQVITDAKRVPGGRASYPTRRQRLVR